MFANREELGTFEQRMPLTGVSLKLIDSRSALMIQIDHVLISGDLASLRLFHYGGRNFVMPYHVVAELTPGKRLDMSAYPKGDLHLLEQVKVENYVFIASSRQQLYDGGGVFLTLPSLPYPYLQTLSSPSPVI